LGQVISIVFPGQLSVCIGLMCLFFFFAFRYKSLLFLGLMVGLAYVRTEQVRPPAPTILYEEVQSMVFVVDDFPVKKPASWSVQAKSLGFWDGFT
jgi:hypothetical protein